MLKRRKLKSDFSIVPRKTGCTLKEDGWRRVKILKHKSLCPVNDNFCITRGTACIIYYPQDEGF